MKLLLWSEMDVQEGRERKTGSNQIIVFSLVCGGREFSNIVGFRFIVDGIGGCYTITRANPQQCGINYCRVSLILVNH